MLIRIIREYNLQDYTLIAMGKMRESDQLTASGSRVLPLPTMGNTYIDDAPVPEKTILPVYPSGQFTINKTKVMFAPASTAWLSIAEQFSLPMSRLWDFNDLETDDDVLQKGQLVYLQRKRKLGAVEFHTMQFNETLYDVCQSEGIRYESLLELNHLKGNMQPAAGEKLYLQSAASARPLLVSEQRSKPVTNAVDVSSNMQSEYTTHLVSTRETLYSISKKYGVETEKIMEWNRLDSMNLRIGQALIIYQR